MWNDLDSGGGGAGGNPVQAYCPGCTVTVDGGPVDDVPVAPALFVGQGYGASGSLPISNTPGLLDPTVCNLPSGTADYTSAVVAQDVAKTNFLQ